MKKHKHVWKTPYNVVGGSKENPGYFSGDNGTTICKECCSECGMYRRRVLNSKDRPVYSKADLASELWVADVLLEKNKSKLEEWERERQTHCPHGKKWEACQACFEYSDFLFDCNRENSWR